MKHTITALLLAAAPLAQAGEWSMTTEAGGTFTLHPETVRVYDNARGLMQMDLLVDFISAEGEHSRKRHGVTGCADGTGLFAQVDINGSSVGLVRNWIAKGDRMYDWAAENICRAGRLRIEKELKKSGKKGVSL